MFGDSKLRIVAFHGFGTRPKTSAFCKIVTKHYSLANNIEIITPKYNYLTSDPAKDFTKLDEQLFDLINDDEPLMFYGISLGGFIARHFALKYECPLALFNPSIKPWLDVEQYVKRMPLLNNIAITRGLLKRVITASKKCKNFFIDEHLSKQALVLTKNDNVLKWQNSYDYFEDKAYIYINEHGGHAFEESDALYESLKQLDKNWLYEKDNKKDNKENQSYQG